MTFDVMGDHYSNGGTLRPLDHDKWHPGDMHLLYVGGDLEDSVALDCQARRVLHRRGVRQPPQSGPKPHQADVGGVPGRGRARAVEPVTIRKWGRGLRGGVYTDQGPHQCAERPGVSEGQTNLPDHLIPVYRL